MKKLGKWHQCSRLHEYLLWFWGRGNYPLAAFCQMIPRIIAEVIRWLTGYQKIFKKNNPIYLILIHCIWLYNSITFIISYYIGLIIALWIHFNLYFAMMELMFTILISIRFVILTQNRIRPIDLLKLSIMIFFLEQTIYEPKWKRFFIFFSLKKMIVFDNVSQLCMLASQISHAIFKWHKTL